MLTKVQAEAIAQIEASAIVSVWQVSYERKVGRSWETRSSVYLSYEKAKGIADNTQACAEHETRRQGRVLTRNVKLEVIHVFTHEND